MIVNPPHTSADTPDMSQLSYPLQDIIGKIPIFKHLNTNHTSYVLRLMSPFFTLTGNYIYSPSDGSDGVYFLLLGTAEVQ